jgi:DNA-3-methyladenine glycosylase
MPRPKKEKIIAPTETAAIFRNPDVVQAARKLLGFGLFTKIDGELTGGIITETEAYAGIHDKASHAYGGRLTKRTEVMYRAGGIAYIYLCYGIHTLLNIVTSDAGIPNGVLIRAIHPTHGLDVMLRRRKKMRVDKTLAKGPGSLTAALGITLALNGSPLDKEPLWIENLGISDLPFDTTPRIGIDYAEECIDLPYRFVVKEGLKLPIAK